MSDLYAHTPNESGEWHRLEEHLLNVAELAKKFGDEFGSGDWAFWRGCGKELNQINNRKGDNK